MPTTLPLAHPAMTSAALRAIDEREAEKRGPLVAALLSPSEATLHRRASLALRRGHTAAEVVTILGLWSHQQALAGRRAS